MDKPILKTTLRWYISVVGKVVWRTGHITDSTSWSVNPLSVDYDQKTFHWVGYWLQCIQNYGGNFRIFKGLCWWVLWMFIYEQFEDWNHCQAWLDWPRPSLSGIWHLLASVNMGWRKVFGCVDSFLVMIPQSSCKTVAAHRWCRDFYEHGMYALVHRWRKCITKGDNCWKCFVFGN